MASAAMRTYSTDGKTPVQQVAAQTWHTRVPVHLALAPDNISSPTGVRPIYLLAPRQGYLNVVASQAWPHLQHVLPTVPGRPGAPRPWFDCGGVPLKWFLPCGVLYDLLAEAGQLPWRLTVHYTHPPPDSSLVGWDPGAPPQAQFLNSLKEACHICRGTDGSGAVMRMGSAAQDELWHAVQAGDVAAYRSALDVLRVAPTGRQGLPPNIPVRLFLRRATPFQSAVAPPAPAGGPSAQPAPSSASADTVATASGLPPGSRAGAAGSASDPGGPAVVVGGGLWESSVTASSRPVPSQQCPGGEPTTLAQLLHLLLPHVFPQLPTAATRTEAGGAAAPRHPPSRGAAQEAAAPEAGVEPEAGRMGSTGRAVEGANAGAVTHIAGPGAELASAAESEAGGDGGDGGHGGQGRVEGALSPGSVGAVNVRSRTGSHPESGVPWGSGEPSVGAEVGRLRASGGGGADEGAPGTTSGDRSGGQGSGLGGGGEGPRGAAAAAGAPSAGTCAEETATGRSGSAGSAAAAAAAGAGANVSDPGAAAEECDLLGAAVRQKTAAREGGLEREAPGRGPEPAAAATGISERAIAAPAGPAHWPSCRVLVGGISPPLAAPIAWLHAAMHAPDLFLYVVVRLDVEAGGREGSKAGSGSVGK